MHLLNRAQKDTKMKEKIVDKFNQSSCEFVSLAETEKFHLNLQSIELN